MKRRLLETNILLFFLFYSCNTKINQIELHDLMETTHQIVFYDNNIVRVRKPEVDGECCSSIQLLNKQFEVVNEIDCLEPYPSILIENDSLIICYSIFKSDEYAFKGGYEYNKEKYQKIGNYKLKYKLRYIFATTLGVDIYFDSIERNGQNITFLRDSQIVARRSIHDLFYENHYFYSFSLQDSIRETINFKPINDDLFVRFFEQLKTSNR